MTYLENWGSGAKRIIDACRAQNVEDPTWSDNGAFITVTFKRPSKSSLEDHVPLNASQNDNHVPLNVPQNDNHVPLNVPQSGQGTQESTLENINSSPEANYSSPEILTSSLEVHQKLRY
jgi:predicted HTH transcriptional regulator